jgi:predicted nuclease of predicted toxin-antitoxin system
LEKERVSLYLDECIRPLLARVLRERGYDCISSLELNLAGASDEDQLLKAAALERAILTFNIVDYVKLHMKYYDSHWGIILSNQIPFRILLHRTLKLVSSLNHSELRGQIKWLSDFAHTEEKWD